MSDFVSYSQDDHSKGGMLFDIKRFEYIKNFSQKAIFFRQHRISLICERNTHGIGTFTHVTLRFSVHQPVASV